MLGSQDPAIVCMLYKQRFRASVARLDRPLSKMVLLGAHERLQGGGGRDG